MGNPSKSVLPKNRREYAAVLKRTEAKVYRRVAADLRTNTGRGLTVEERAERYDLFAQICEDDARFAETDRGVDAPSIVNDIISRVLA